MSIILIDSILSSDTVYVILLYLISAKVQSRKIKEQISTWWKTVKPEKKPIALRGNSTSHYRDILLTFEKFRTLTLTGADPGFQVRGTHLKTIAPSGARCENYWGYFVWKITILSKNIIFFSILGGGAPPPLDPPLVGLWHRLYTTCTFSTNLVSRTCGQEFMILNIRNNS